WAAMSAAPAVRLEAPVEVRAARTVRDYAGLDAAAIDGALGRLPRHISRETVAGWRALAAAGDRLTLATELIVNHYDPAYRRQGGAAGRECLAAVPVASLDAGALDRAADAVAAAVREATARCTR